MIQRSAQFWFFRKVSANSFFTTFWIWFFKKNVCHVIFYYLTKFNCLIAFTSGWLWDEGHNLCIAIVCFPGCDVINFEINFIFLNKPFSFLTKRSSQKFKYLENENSFYSETKSILHLLKGFSVDKIVSHQKVRL